MSVQQIMEDATPWLSYDMPNLPKVVRQEIMAQLRARLTEKCGRAQ